MRNQAEPHRDEMRARLTLRGARVGNMRLLRPSGFKIPIRDIRASVGAGFLYPLVGEVRDA